VSLAALGASPGSGQADPNLQRPGAREPLGVPSRSLFSPSARMPPTWLLPGPGLRGTPSCEGSQTATTCQRLRGLRGIGIVAEVPSAAGVAPSSKAARAPTPTAATAADASPSWGPTSPLPPRLTAAQAIRRAKTKTLGAAPASRTLLGDARKRRRMERMAQSPERTRPEPLSRRLLRPSSGPSGARRGTLTASTRRQLTRESRSSSAGDRLDKVSLPPASRR